MKVKGKLGELHVDSAVKEKTLVCLDLTTAGWGGGHEGREGEGAEGGPDGGSGEARGF